MVANDTNENCQSKTYMNNCSCDDMLHQVIFSLICFISFHFKLSACQICLQDCHDTSLSTLKENCIDFGEDRELVQFCFFHLNRSGRGHTALKKTSIITLKKWPVSERSCTNFCHQRQKCSFSAHSCMIGFKLREKMTTNSKIHLRKLNSKTTPTVKSVSISSPHTELCSKIVSTEPSKGKSVPKQRCKNCKGENKRCDGDRCVCQLGYSSVEGTNRCVKGCTLYSAHFELQSERLCKDAYFTKHIDINNSECRRRCVQSELRLCAAYEMYKGKCFLMTVSQTTKTSKPWVEWTKCTHRQRKCRGCDSTCRPPKYACDNRHCVCNYGYIPVADGTCVKKCSRYTEVFSVQMQHKCYKVQPQDRSYTVKTVGECMQICQSRTVCSSVEVKCNQCIIQVQSNDWFHENAWMFNKNCQHYNRLCRKLGPRCTKICSGPNYICIDGKCVCANGYSRTTDRKCVQACTKYSKSYSLQQENRCMASYVEERQWEGVEACMNACTRAKFQCASAEKFESKCYLDKYRIIPVLRDFVGCTHFSRNCAHSGGDCDACDGPNYRCRDGKCQCSRGYSRVAQYKTCVQECFNYSTTFAKQTTTHCIHKYEKKFRNTNAHACRKRCLLQKDFECGAFHIYNGNCYLMEWTQDIAEKKWEVYTKCTHYSRDCHPVCEVGLIRVVGTNECVQRCWKYADTFQLVSSTWCLSSVLDTFSHVDKDRCKQQCIDYNKQMCEGFEVTTKHCHLVSTTIRSSIKWKKRQHCQFYQRLCVEGGF